MEQRVDLHVHSIHSNNPYSWFLRAFKAGECYTKVEEVYRLATARGMTLVTLTDHDTIDGALELCARHENTFISEEVSARFPEDGCIVHTIVLGITEAQHAEIARLRRNIYELVAYLQREQIVYYWCHPLSDVNRRLKRWHIEASLLMFPWLEARNGTRDVAHERRLRRLVASITPEQLAQWAEQHTKAPWLVHRPNYGWVGGSDDHGTLAIARAHTVFRGAPTFASLREALLARTTEPGGETGTGDTLAHNVYGVLTGYLRRSSPQPNPELSAPIAAEPSLRAHGIAEKAPSGDAEDSAPRGTSRAALDGAKGSLQRFGAGLLQDFIAGGGTLNNLADKGHLAEFQQRLRRGADAALIGGWRKAVAEMANSLSSGDIGRAFDAVPQLLKLAFAEAPYVMAYRYHARDRHTAYRHSDDLLGDRVSRLRPKVAVFSDTVQSIDGVAIGLRKLADAAVREGHDMLLIGASHEVDRTTTCADGTILLPSIYAHRLAEYPQLAWQVPHLPAVLTLLEEHQIEVVQCSTPGPVGMAALVAAKLMNLPVVGQYHTDVPAYAQAVLGDALAAEAAAKAVGAFYRAMDRVLVPSKSVAETVSKLGVSADKIRQIPRGIDLELFTAVTSLSATDSAPLWRAGFRVLYVGRISREKKIEAALHAFSLVRRAIGDAEFVLVGDGPMRAEYAARNLPGVSFVGELTGAALAAAYQRAHAFLFLSETETFGNVVVEAMAAGLPVIVSNRGAAHEHIDAGQTGFAVDARDESAAAEKLFLLATDVERRHAMAQACLKAASRYTFSAAVRGTFREYALALEDRYRPELSVRAGGGVGISS